MKPYALVFGANSAIAQALMPHLLSEYQVLAISRQAPAQLPEGVRHFTCDYSEAALAELAEQIKENGGPVTALFCAVGVLHGTAEGEHRYPEKKLAELNMLVKTASVELARSHRKLCLIALHPGTTDTPLSKPFTSSLGPDKLFSPELTAERLWSVIQALTPEDTGRFIHWDGSDLPW
ncbi:MULTISPECIES: hypothetical protein [unclassified Marinimicrobium]|jgi:NAD(P)-dependent dehydrogenase (short-subunit alcohol dehydrogenase family)|uniref:hypothetical protein n=1 Tax=unclassified Marinimicrobium TaxID=2632100 RepID=UPI000C3C5429|nr:MULTISPECIES: hypothetical protein [unclassified Marinimicrobium]MAN52774.1 hypothetical protein [Marinimicrobium sp.]